MPQVESTHDVAVAGERAPAGTEPSTSPVAEGEVDATARRPEQKQILPDGR